MTAEENNKTPLEETAKGLAELLKIHPAEAVDLLSPTADEVAAVRMDPTFCAVLARVSLIAPYFFPVQPSNDLKQLAQALSPIRKEAAFYTNDTKDSDENITTQLMKLRGEYHAMKNFEPQLNKEYVFNRIHLAICIYYILAYGEPLPRELHMTIPSPEKRELAELTRMPSRQELVVMTGIIEDLLDKVNGKIADEDEKAVASLTESGVHPMIAKRIRKTDTQRLVASTQREVYPTRENLIDLATDHKRLDALLNTAIRFQNARDKIW